MALSDDLLGIGIATAAVGITLSLFGHLFKGASNAADKGFGFFGK